MLAAEEEHRDHAICEQGFAGIIDGPLAHLPHVDFSASAAWAVLAAISQNILRAVGALASLFHARAHHLDMDGPRKGGRQGPLRPVSPGKTPRAAIGPGTLPRQWSVDPG
jgi:hypothetical protein